MNPDQSHASTPQVGTNDQALNALLEQVRSLVQAARKTAATAINSLQVITSFEIGRMIVEHEQQGAQRAQYGQLVLKTLSDRLTAEFGRGFSKSNLEYMRRFFLEYRNRAEQIAQMASGQSAAIFSLSWSQYIFLLSINNPAERQFYEIESATNGWTLPELRRQFNSSLYERLALSRDKDDVRRLALEGQTVSNPKDLLKEPYVLDFWGWTKRHNTQNLTLKLLSSTSWNIFFWSLGKAFCLRPVKSVSPLTTTISSLTLFSTTACCVAMC
jgi:predicted nuclease of restriction endonuclease-like (RecB) superfamily